MGRPRLVVTGASGFIGRHLLDLFKEEYEIVGMARRSQSRCGAPVHPNISWFQVDIVDRESLARSFDVVREAGGRNIVVHLAAHYDFSGGNEADYWRTNVDGLRNVLEECALLDLDGFVFPSSLAACAFPRHGRRLDESSPADGDHVYAVTKRVGEEMLAEYDRRIRSVIIRFAALFSDWCEYPPLYFFLETWLSRAWNARILGGRGTSAIPYMHVRELGPLLRRVFARLGELEQREVLIGSPSSTVSHRELFDLANLNFRGHRLRPVLMPKPACVVGLWARDLLCRFLGNRPFERPWMLRYLDLSLGVDASHTYERLGWRPRERLLMTRRMPFLVDHLKRDPVEWYRRNREALKEVRLRPNLRIHSLLERHHGTIREAFLAELVSPDHGERFSTYRAVRAEILDWRYVVVLRHLMNSVRAADKGLFTGYCRDLAVRRFEEGFSAREVCGALQLLHDTCLEVVRGDPRAEGFDEALHDYLSMTFEFGCDQVMETFEELGAEVEERREASLSP